MRKEKKMMCRKYSNLGYLLIMAIALVTVMSVSLVKAEMVIESDVDALHSDTIAPHDESEDNEPVEEQAEDDVIEEIKLLIVGMADEKDAMKVNEALWKCDGVESVEVSYKDAKATIKAYVEEISYIEIITAIEDAGFTVVIEE